MVHKKPIYVCRAGGSACVVGGREGSGGGGGKGAVVGADISALLANVDIEPGKASTPASIAAAAKWTTIEDQEDVAEALTNVNNNDAHDSHKQKLDDR